MSHPISGSEASGPKYGSKSLFKNKWCILIKSKKNKLLENKLSRFWKKLGAKVLFMQKESMIKFFLLRSPTHLIAFNLIKTAQDFQKTNKKNIIKYSAGGLRDFSRIAAPMKLCGGMYFLTIEKTCLE